MPASANRQERRRAAKLNKTPWTLRLLEYSGNKVTAGVYYDIMNTSWRGASKCGYTFEEGMGWHTVLNTSKFYFAPLRDKFEVNVATGWSDQTRMLFTVQGSSMLVNITFKRTETQTLTLHLPNCVLDLSKLEEVISKKSSSLFQLALNSWRTCVREYPLERRKELVQAYIDGGHNEDWAKIMSGLAPQEYLEYNICVVLIGDVLTPLLQVFRTLAFMDYTMQRGGMLLEDHHEFSLSPTAVADIEAVCINHLTPISSCPITYRDVPGDVVRVEGNPYRFYDHYTAPVGARMVEWLRNYIEEPVLDLEAVTEHSKGRYFYLDAKGNPIEGGSHEDRHQASWMLTATGLHKKLGHFPIFGFYKHVGNEAEWEFIAFVIAMDVFRKFDGEHLSGLSIAKWQPVITSTFELKGRGLRGSVEEEEEIPDKVRYYKCSNEMFETLQPGSNIKTLDQMNYFIEGFIRMLRRRKAESTCGVLYNTGLVNRDGQYMWLSIPNLMGKFDKLQPDLVILQNYSLYSDGAYRFYREPRYLFLGDQKIKVDENSLRHVSKDREYRIPPELASLSKTQLMDWVRDSIRYAQFMLCYNPLFAQPCYSERYDRVCHLIPLYSDHKYDQEHLAGALFIHEGRVATIYTVAMARDHACLFNIPKAVWLPD